jgi:transposase
MMDYHLPAEKLAELRAAHRSTRDKREADRIKAVVLLASGWRAEDVADALLVDPNTVRNHFKTYQAEGLSGLLHRGSDCELSEAQRQALDAHVQANLYLSAKDVAVWVEAEFGVVYTDSGMTALLHRLGFVYKKPNLVSGKADPAAQEAHLAKYEELKKHKGENDVICFMDAVHPQHNPVLSYGRIKRGAEHEVPSNSGRERVNINGAIDLEPLEPVVCFDDSINAESTFALFAQLEKFYVVARHPSFLSLHIVPNP